VNKLELMRVFMMVCDRGSFVAASQSLNVSAPVVTRSVAQLEAHLGVKLFTRTTRKIALTESGQIYQQECERILMDIQRAEDVVSGSYAEPKGTLMVSAPVLFGRMHVLPIINQFLNQFPDVDVRLMLQDHIINLVDEKIEVAVRIGHLSDSGLYAKHVGYVHRYVVASRHYIDHFGEPQTPDDLNKHRIITTQWDKRFARWTFNGKTNIESIKLTPRFVTNNMGAAIEAVLSNQGICQALSYQVIEHIESGKLCDY
jgi:DNA-binding transcriptional LysR family regulator